MSRAVIYDVRQQTYTLTTGRRVYAPRGVLGIGPQGDDVSSGYDEAIDLDGDDPWTTAERRELADEMIRRWERFKRGGRAAWPHEDEPD